MLQAAILVEFEEDGRWRHVNETWGMPLSVEIQFFGLEKKFFSPSIKT
ncbi:Putative protein [Zobellia galactanivorans]|uniref:Uncharacterized protein n=1 Tax=Zobellia galactanivorans (strain DSM 12802 / CCUG 47099 / CIP 106680 / NCIMB 13871 / Dsij) TaxID=63186 RepID=G0L952_ZOBGA|nr:Putative protein [Zobellia galactanivorans]